MTKCNTLDQFDVMSLNFVTLLNTFGISKVLEIAGIYFRSFTFWYTSGLLLFVIYVNDLHGAINNFHVIS